MPAPNRAETLRRTKGVSREARRGFVVVIEGRDEPHYGFVDELQKALANEAEAARIVKAAEEAVAAYDPEKEAVVIDERAEGIFVLIRSEIETRVAGEFFWTKPT